MRKSPEELVRDLAASIDATLARQVVECYVEMQQRYLAGDWKPTELDGGRFCEAISRALYQLDCGVVTYSQLPGDIRKKLLDEDGVTRSHNMADKDRRHIVKAVETVYKFRSDRGAVHISPTHTANGMDSMFVVHVCKWILAEFLRLAWTADKELVASVIEQLVQLEVALIHDLDGEPLVLAKDISATEEVLLLLNHATSNRLTRAEIKECASNQKLDTVSKAIRRLIADKAIRPAGPDEVALTPKGQKRVLEEIVPKWVGRRF